MPQIPSRLPREYESPSPDHRTRYTGVVNTVLRCSNVLHFHQRVCHQVDDTMVRTSRFTVLMIYLRALQGHSGCNLIEPTLQDNVIIQGNFFQYFYHIGCAFNLHSIISSGLIPGGQSSSNRQTVFFLLVDPMDKEP